MLVLNFQRMSTEDGPGLRTTLFVKGCPLKCEWCHNPESIPFKLQNEWVGVRCIGCNTCLKVCDNGAIFADKNGIKIDFDKCTNCGKCIEACPTGALEQKGMYMSVDDVYATLIKDKSYWGKDGGITLSGGEILMQSVEASKLLKKIKVSNINIAIDTCGFCKKQDIDNIFDNTDLFLYDIKLFDNVQHKAFTGQDNKIIKENFEYLVEKCKGTNKRIWVRTPIIPNATDSDENIRNIANFIKGKVEIWEMCAFNNLCRDKYERLYKEWDYKATPLMEEKRMNELVNIAKAQGMNNAKWSGMTKKGE